MKNVNVIQALNVQIRLLRAAYMDLNHGYKRIVDDEDADNLLNENDKTRLKKIAQYLYHALCIAKEKYNPNIKDRPDLQWDAITQEALDEVNKFDSRGEDAYDSDNKNEIKLHYRITCNRTLQQKHRMFRDALAFPNPYRCDKRRGITIPPILDDNHDFRDKIRNWCNKNLSSLSIESCHHFIKEKALPELVRTINQQKHEDDKEVTIRSLLESYNYKCLSLSTVGRWLNLQSR